MSGLFCGAVSAVAACSGCCVGCSPLTLAAVNVAVATVAVATDWVAGHILRGALQVARWALRAAQRGIMGPQHLINVVVIPRVVLRRCLGLCPCLSCIERL